MMKSFQNILMIRFIFIVVFLTTLSFANDKKNLELTKNISYIVSPLLYEVDYSKFRPSLQSVFMENQNIQAIEIIDALSKKVVFQAYKNNEKLIDSKVIPSNLLSLDTLEYNSIYENEIVGRVVVYFNNISGLNLTSKEIEYLKSHNIITMCNKHYRAPYEFLNSQNKVEGIVVDTMNLLSQKIGHGVHFKSIHADTWKVSKKFLQDGKCDIIPAISYSKKRENIGSFTQPYIKSRFVIITRKDAPFLANIEEIKHKKIARKKGSGFTKKIKARYPDINIVDVKNYEEAFLKVASGEVYATIALSPVANYHIKSLALDNLKIAGMIDVPADLSILVSKENKILHSILTKALHQFSQDEYKKIEKNYMNINIIMKNGKDYKKVIYIALVVILILLIVIILTLITKKKLEEKIQHEVEKNRKNELHLLEQSKMAAMGDMIGNIAHQWRQPLTTISTKATGSIFQKEMGLLSDQVFIDNMESINENAQYLSQTIDIFKNFIKGSNEIVDVDIKCEISNAIKIVEGTLKNFYINLEFDTLENDYTLKAIEGELSQVIINIINNAKDALLENKIENPTIVIKLNRDASNAIITIDDNAQGIPEEILPRIFEPYFTTKHQSQGTGLGLQMSFRLITESFGGKIYAKNTDTGARFTIELPFNS